MKIREHQISVQTPEGEKKVAFSTGEWKQAIDHLKPRESLRCLLNEERSIHPITQKEPSLIGRVWARIARDVSLQNTARCLREIMNEEIDSLPQLHTALHLLRALDCDPLLQKCFEKQEIHHFRQHILHALIPQFLQNGETLQRKRELQSLWVLSRADVELKQKLKQDPRYPIVRALITNIEHAIKEIEQQEKRLEKLKGIRAELSLVAKQTGHYLEALHALGPLLIQLEKINEEDLRQFENTKLSYTIAAALLSSFQDAIDGEDRSLLSASDFDKQVGELAEAYQKNFFHLLPQLTVLVFYDTGLQRLFHKIKDDSFLKTNWWDSLPLEVRHTLCPRETRSFNILKLFRPAHSVHAFLINYENQLEELHALMPKYSPGWKKLSRCLEETTAGYFT